jgi:hypothetical protein
VIGPHGVEVAVAIRGQGGSVVDALELEGVIGIRGT